MQAVTPHVKAKKIQLLQQQVPQELQEPQELLKQEKLHENMRGGNHIALLLAPGCSGSTFAYTVLRDLMEWHNVHVWSPGKEWFQPDIARFEANRMFCTEANGTTHKWPYDPVAKLEVATAVLEGRVKCKELDFTGPTVFFMVGNHMNQTDYDRIFASLAKSKAWVAGMQRANYLDHHICMVKDCFGRRDDRTYPVDRKGKRSDACFSRRKLSKEDAAGYKVRLNAGILAKELAAFEAFWNTTNYRNIWARWGYGEMPSETLESLASFEYSDEAQELHKSVDAFANLLDGLGIRANKKIVLEYLQQQLMDRSEPRTLLRHSDVVYNSHEVARALRHTKYSWMWQN